MTYQVLLMMQVGKQVNFVHVQRYYRTPEQAERNRKRMLDEYDGIIAAYVKPSTMPPNT